MAQTYAQRQTAVLDKISAAGKSDSIDIIVQPNNNTTPFNQPHRVLQSYSPANIWVLRFRATDISAQDFKKAYFDLAKKPVEELTTGSLDITLNSLAIAHRSFPAINGSGMRISIKEQSFDTADIDYKGRHFNSGLAANNTTTHAAIMATIAVGGGNSSPLATGAAPAAMVTSSSFDNLLPDADAVFQANDLFIQNHSYGTVVENYYGLEALAYDAQAALMPQLLHVFSAGNSGTAVGAGPYTSVPGRANITGNFKYAKNVLTVGAVDSFGTVAALSSKGPAFDGRIKPELVAFGEDGSSGAAALVSGTAALLQQAYRQQKAKLPEAALLKAVLINSADDAGLPGVDYQSGWGNVNAKAAVQTILENRTATVIAGKGERKIVPVNIPGGAKRLRMTASWTDAPAQVNTAKALVNDIDIFLQQTTSGVQWLPWVLSAHPDSLDVPAKRGIDTVNNTEQVTIELPAAGTYQLLIDGKKMASDNQVVAVAWQIDMLNGLEFTNPVQGKSVESGKPFLLRWHTTIDDTATLQYSKNGAVWQTIASGINLKKQHYSWVPPEASGVLQLRMLLPNNAIALSDSFVVSQPVNLQVGLQCADSVLLYWNATANNTYQLYQLRTHYMEPLQQVRDSFVVLQHPGADKGIYAIAPVVNGFAGLRSFALNVAASGAGCYFKGFFVQNQTDAFIQLRGELGSLYNLRELHFQKRRGADFENLQTITPQLLLTVTDSALKQGANQYRLQAVLVNGQTINSEPVIVYHFTSLPVQAFPNPVAANGTITLVTALAGKYTVAVIDSWGRQRQHLTLQNAITTIKAPASTGIYFIRMYSDDGITGEFKIVVL